MLPVWLEADAPTGVVPGARGRGRPRAVGAARRGHTTAFDDTVAWLAVATATYTVCQLLRIAWRTVEPIVTRFADEAKAGRDPLQGLRRIGIDEISYKRGRGPPAGVERRLVRVVEEPR